MEQIVDQVVSVIVVLVAIGIPVCAVILGIFALGVRHGDNRTARNRAAAQDGPDPVGWVDGPIAGPGAARVMDSLRDRGASAVEYGLLVAAIALVVVGVTFTLGKLVSSQLDKTRTCIASSGQPGAACGVPDAPAPPDPQAT